MKSCSLPKRCCNTYLSYKPYRLLSEPENYLVTSEAKANVTPDRTLDYSCCGYTTWIPIQIGWFFCLILCFKLSHSQHHILRMLLRKGPQKKVLHHNCSFKTKLTPLILIF